LPFIGSSKVQAVRHAIRHDGVFLTDGGVCDGSEVSARDWRWWPDAPPIQPSIAFSLRLGLPFAPSWPLDPSAKS
jgi:hypothetical protein